MFALFWTAYIDIYIYISSFYAYQIFNNYHGNRLGNKLFILYTVLAEQKELCSYNLQEICFELLSTIQVY